MSPKASRQSAPARAQAIPVSMPSEPAWKFVPLASPLMALAVTGNP